jgi:2,4-dienoyl-CoA reductase-like NADH-dependent reductase (Old Yellow Enzyme family)
MWHPPQRIRHAPLAPRWPDAAEAAASRLFSPVDVGRIHLADRTWVPAMVPWRATDDGFVTDDVLAWYERFAQGQPGVIVVEATGVRDIPSGPLLRIGDDRFVPGLTSLVETVRRASGGRTKLLIQIIDFLSIRRRPSRETFLGRYLTITSAHRRAVGSGREPGESGAVGSGREPGESGESAAGASVRADADAAVRAALLALPDDQLRQVLDPREIEAMDFGLRERVTDMAAPHIRDLPQVLPPIFAAAARRAEAAGFDGVELHYAHAYTMASFLSARNTRPDGYGGPREHRVRLPLEVFHAVRGAVSQAFIVGCRYLSDECVEAGGTVDDAVHFGTAFARAGMDFLSLSRGGKFEDAKQPKVGWAAYPYTGPSGWECMPTVLADEAGPFGRNVAPARRIREAVRAAGCETPIVVAGGIHSFDQAEAILASGAADILGAARQSLADPDWFLKLRTGHGGEVRQCAYTNYCEGLDQMHKQVTCKLWDRLDLDEPGIAKAADGRRRLLAPAWTR